MPLMAEKHPRKGDRHRHKQLNLRLHSVLRAQLEILADRNLTNLTIEATAAIRKHLAENGLWPPIRKETVP